MTRAPVLDARPHFTAAKARIGAVHTQLGIDTYRFGEVPGTLGPNGQLNPGERPAIYVLVQVERTYYPSAKQTHSTRSTWRISLRYVGATYSEAEWAGARISEAFESTTLNVAGFLSKPLAHDVSDPVAADDGMFSGFVAFTYAL